MGSNTTPTTEASSISGELQINHGDKSIEENVVTIMVALLRPDQVCFLLFTSLKNNSILSKIWVVFELFLSRFHSILRKNHSFLSHHSILITNHSFLSLQSIKVYSLQHQRALLSFQGQKPREEKKLTIATYSLWGVFQDELFWVENQVWRLSKLIMQSFKSIRDSMFMQ